MSTVYPDVSEYQTVSNDAYNRPFFMFRAVNEYGYLDQKVRANLAWALSARARGLIANFGFYVIPCLTSNAQILGQLNNVGMPHDCVGMIDMESWAGRVRGNQSETVNDLAYSLRDRQGSRSALVWGYGNSGDFDGIWPARPNWLGCILASYGPLWTKAGLIQIGQQYTNGQENHTGLPSSTPPFGNCDHNVLNVLIPTPSGGGYSPSGGGIPLPTPNPAPTGGFMSDLSPAQQIEVYNSVKGMRQNIGLTAAQQQEAHNASLNALKLLGSVFTQLSSGNASQARQYAAIQAEFAKLGGTS